MKRPAGLVVSAVVLVLVAVGIFAFAALIAIGLYVTHVHPQIPPQPPLLGYLLLTVIVLSLAVTAWAASTVAGLLSMKPWSRYSILVIGGLLAAFGGLSLVGILIAALAGPMLPSSTANPGVAPAILHAILAVIALVYAAVAAVGVWWLVYFTRPAIIAAFGPRNGKSGLSFKPAPPGRRPIAITILAWLYLFGAVTCLVLAFVPLPGFLLGAILSGTSGHVLYALVALLNAFIGVGLLRLFPVARLAAIAISSLGSINTLMSLLPWYHARFQAYTEQLSNALHFPLAPPHGNFHLQAAQLVTTGVFGLSINIFAIWLLHRDRAAFTPPPPAPPAIYAAT